MVISSGVSLEIKHITNLELDWSGRVSNPEGRMLQSRASNLSPDEKMQPSNRYRGGTNQVRLMLLPCES